jgi:hypothetical protein
MPQYQLTALQNLCHCRVFRNVASRSFVALNIQFVILALNRLFDRLLTMCLQCQVKHVRLQFHCVSELLLKSIKTKNLSCTTRSISKVNPSSCIIYNFHKCIKDIFLLWVQKQKMYSKQFPLMYRDCTVFYVATLN